MRHHFGKDSGLCTSKDYAPVVHRPDNHRGELGGEPKTTSRHFKARVPTKMPRRSLEYAGVDEVDEVAAVELVGTGGDGDEQVANAGDIQVEVEEFFAVLDVPLK